MCIGRLSVCTLIRITARITLECLSTFVMLLSEMKITSILYTIPKWTTNHTELLSCTVHGLWNKLLVNLVESLQRDKIPCNFLVHFLISQLHEIITTNQYLYPPLLLAFFGRPINNLLVYQINLFFVQFDNHSKKICASMWI